MLPTSLEQPLRLPSPSEATRSPAHSSRHTQPQPDFSSQHRAGPVQTWFPPMTSSSPPLCFQLRSLQLLFQSRVLVLSWGDSPHSGHIRQCLETSVVVTVEDVLLASSRHRSGTLLSISVHRMAPQTPTPSPHGTILSAVQRRRNLVCKMATATWPCLLPSQIRDYPCPQLSLRSRGPCRRPKG